MRVRIKELISKNNHILYAVPYQHFTNSIENYFSMLKSRLQKTEGLKYTDLKVNIASVLRNIPKQNYENIFKGHLLVHKTRKKPLKIYL